MFDKVNVASIISDHIDTLRDFTTHRRAISDLVLFFATPTAAAIFSAWKGVRLRIEAVNGLLTAFSIFVAILPSLLIMVLTFLQSTQGDPADRSLQLRKRFLREITANLSFSILLALTLVGISIVSLVELQRATDPIGPIGTLLLVAGSTNFVLTLLMVLRRMYALVTNEFDRHRFNRAA
jgi:hypothetical protein